MPPKKRKIPTDMVPTKSPKAAPKKRKTAKDLLPATPSESAVNKDAVKLRKIISASGVDVVGDLMARLKDGDKKTVDFLKTIYSLKETKICLLCNGRFLPGNPSKCSLKHDVDWCDFEPEWEHFECHSGTYKGGCARCRKDFEVDGDDESPDESQLDLCYNEGHVSSEKEMRKFLTSLRKGRP